MSAGDPDWGSPVETFSQGYTWRMPTKTAAPDSASSTATLESFNPATGDLVGEVATITPDQVQGIVDEVAAVQPAWAQLSAADRASYIDRTAAILLERLDDIARLLTAEQGKPISESYTMELLPSIDALKWCAKEGPKILKDEKISFPQALFKTKQSKFRFLLLNLQLQLPDPSREITRFGVLSLIVA